MLHATLQCRPKARQASTPSWAVKHRAARVRGDRGHVLHVIAQAQAGMLGDARVAGEHYAEKPLKIVFVSAEVGPWSKTGGLGDVVGEREPGAVSGLKHVKRPTDEAPLWQVKWLSAGRLSSMGLHQRWPSISCAPGSPLQSSPVTPPMLPQQTSSAAAGGLPIELARRGHKVMTVAPRWAQLLLMGLPAHLHRH